MPPPCKEIDVASNKCGRKTDAFGPTNSQTAMVGHGVDAHPNSGL